LVQCIRKTVRARHVEVEFSHILIQLCRGWRAELKIV
jgi:hypothetical protein